MPLLRKIIVQDFRNIALAELEFASKINCISGSNGTGKTNLLDAVYYLSMTKSAFNYSDRYSFRHGQGAFSLSGTYEFPGAAGQSVVSVKVTGDEKKFRFDDKPCKRISGHIGRIPVVMIAPSDTQLVGDSAEERRRFLNAVLSQMDPGYLADVQQYGRLLAARNAELKKKQAADDGLLEVIEMQMSPLADRISAARRAFVSELSPIVGDFCGRLSGDGEKADVRYRTELDAGPLEDQMRMFRQKDKFLGFTGCGVQRDDLVFGMDGHRIKYFGSQGQQKSFIIALKFAQYDIMRRTCGKKPILLLDDVFDKLDMRRTENLVSLVAGLDFGQIFITDSNKVRLQGIVDPVTDDRAYFDVCDGVFTRV